MRQTKTPLPAASPSCLRTHGAACHRQCPGRRHAGRGQHLLREHLRPLDARSVAAGAEDGDPAEAEPVREPRYERDLGADDDEPDVQRPRERAHAIHVLRAHRVAVAELGDARIARCGVELLELGALRELPGQRVLPAPRADDEDTHAPSLSGVSLGCSRRPSTSAPSGSLLEQVGERRELLARRSAPRTARGSRAMCETGASSSFSRPASVSTA